MIQRCQLMCVADKFIRVIDKRKLGSFLQQLEDVIFRSKK